MTSLPSSVAQPLPTLATNMGGRLARESDALRFLPPVTVMAAQFMYISRLPTLLNQVQAKSISPEGVSSGKVNFQLESPMAGQLPMKEWMTFQVLPLSWESEDWQLPPLWLAWPVMLML